MALVQWVRISLENTKAMMTCKEAAWLTGSCAGGDAQIKVIGVGGGGGNAINRMIASGLQVEHGSHDLLSSCHHAAI